MSLRSQEFEDQVRAALRGEEAVWTPECPEPETLLDWIEQEDAHPQAASLLDHLVGCAYCRREMAAIRETEALVREMENEAASASAMLTDTAGPVILEAGRLRDAGVKALPRKVATWVRDLMTDGVAAPIKAVGDALKTLDRLAVQSPLALARSTGAPTALRPAFTAIRMTRPSLRWSAVEGASEYRVVIARRIDETRRRLVWKGSAGSLTAHLLPEEIHMEPGGAYLWQVTAVREGQEAPSPFAGFVVLTESIRRHVESLESEVGDSALALAGIYEAHGLYEEALEQAERLIGLNPDNNIALAIRDRLRLQLRHRSEPILDAQ